MSDLAAAAAAAGVAHEVADVETWSYPSGQPLSPEARSEPSDAFQLPSVDDLEVAALAAASAMQAIQELQAPKEPSSSEESSDEGSSSSGEEESSGDEDASSSGDDEACDGWVSVALGVGAAHLAAADEEEEGAAGAGGPCLEEDLGWSSAVAPVTDVTVEADEQLTPAGSITAVLEGMVVMQGMENARALDVGTVLLLEDRSLIGRIEEVFGPVTAPMYAMRYAGPQPPPAALCPGSRVFTTERLKQLVDDQQGDVVPRQPMSLAVSGISVAPVPAVLGSL
eukprot:gene8434-8616_t